MDVFIFKNMSIQFKCTTSFRYNIYSLQATKNFFLLSRAATFHAFQYNSGVRKDVGHIYAQTKGRGFQKHSPLLSSVPQYLPFLSSNSSCHPPSVGKMSVGTPSSGVPSQRPCCVMGHLSQLLVSLHEGYLKIGVKP